MGRGTKEDESSPGRVWVAGFHHVTARSLLARFLKIINLYFFKFPIFFFGPRSTADTESADTAVHLYICSFFGENNR